MRWVGRAAGCASALVLCAVAPGAAGEVPADFNGDRRSELAIGVPNEGATESESGAGAAFVVSGSSRGLLADDTTIWNGDSEFLLGDGAESDDDFATTMAAGDFDGDGRADLAVATPSECLRTPGCTSDDGAVHVLYGTAIGLSATHDQLFYPGMAGLAGAEPESQQFGSALVAGDFDGDGDDDLTVGAYRADVGEGADGTNAGQVHVLLGTGQGLTLAGDRAISAASDGLGGDGAGISENFGRSLAAGDLNSDGRDELIVGEPQEDLEALTPNYGHGAIHVLRGTASGPKPAGIYFTQDSPGIAGDGAEGGSGVGSILGDQFGSTLTSGDLDGDGNDDLAIGVPREGDETLGEVADHNAGAVHVMFGSAKVLTTKGDYVVTGESEEIGGDGAEDDDELGATLAIGDVDRDGLEDLAIGSPGEALEGTAEGVAHGRVYVLRRGLRQLRPSGHQLFTQATSGVKGGPEDGDQFGAALALADFDGDRRSDLAIGVPGEDLAEFSGEAQGLVHALYGAPGGLTTLGDELLDEGADEFPGTPAANERFGRALVGGP